MTDTWIDGGGAVADQPLPEGSWIRFVVDPDDRERDLSVRIIDGELHVIGMWKPLVIRHRAGNHTSISTIR